MSGDLKSAQLKPISLGLELNCATLPPHVPMQSQPAHGLTPVILGAGGIQEVVSLWREDPEVSPAQLNDSERRLLRAAKTEFAFAVGVRDRMGQLKCGAILAPFVFSNDAIIVFLRVEAGLRRCGLASKMLGLLEETARERGIRNIFIDAANDASRLLCLKNNFELVCGGKLAKTSRLRKSIGAIDRERVEGLSMPVKGPPAEVTLRRACLMESHEANTPNVVSC